MSRSRLPSGTFRQQATVIHRKGFACDETIAWSRSASGTYPTKRSLHCASRTPIRCTEKGAAMPTRSAILVTLLGTACLGSDQAGGHKPFADIQCEGTYRHHLQGICTDGQGEIFWSFTTTLVKTDAAGKVLKQIPVANHHGDLCYLDGKIYVAVNLGKFNNPQGKADSWVYVYKADDLTEIARHKTPEVFHGAGGIGYREGHFFVVGGLPPGVEENYVYEYDRDFHFVKRHVIESGYTLLGIQTAACADGFWWFGCYGKPAVTLKTDLDFRMVGRYEFNCSLGIVGLPDEKLFVARGHCQRDKGCTGRALVATADAQKGITISKETR